MLCVPLTITYRYMCTGNNALGLAADNMRSSGFSLLILLLFLLPQTSLCTGTGTVNR